MSPAHRVEPTEATTTTTTTTRLVIHPPQQTRVLSLCLNRVLQEPGVSKLVQGYYKGVLEAEVWDRIQSVAAELRAADEVNERVYAMYQELLAYMEYYADHVVFVTKVMNLMGSMTGRVPTIHKGLIMTVFDGILASTSHHPHQLLKPFFTFVLQQLDRSNLSGWVNGRYTQRSSSFCEHLESSGALHFMLHVGHHIGSYTDPIKSSSNEDGALTIVMGICAISQIVFDYMFRKGQHDDPMFHMLFACAESMKRLLHKEFGFDDQRFVGIEEEFEDDDSGDEISL